jgi:hypothetical protein
MQQGVYPSTVLAALHAYKRVLRKLIVIELLQNGGLRQHP